MRRLPVWFRQEIPGEAVLERMGMLCRSNTRTVCREAKCPNITSCFEEKRLTFMILGDTCTRNCRFCAVDKSDKVKELSLDSDEPERIAAVVRELKMDYAVITSVTRDDLEDGGAGMFARVVELIHGIDTDIKIELLIPDLQGKISSLKCILDARPDVVGHNIETVSRLYQELRPEASYKLSLEILSQIKKISLSVITKSSIMLGLGEREEEVIDTMGDLRRYQCDILTLGQYLAPSAGHYPVKEFIDVEQFKKLERIAVALGFKAVLSGPLVRSSYQSEEVYREALYA
ncbi:MAG: lipoyl synthase [Candidatus Omnitrophica bacterium]|nr:lipoyl synthase [Candidatus Omnitrophota bacterium]